MNTHFDLRSKQDGEETKVKLDALTKRLDDIQKDGFSDEIKQDIKKMIMQDVQKSLDTDVQNLMEKNMQILIEKDISKLIERETNKVVKAELASYEQKLKGKRFLIKIGKINGKINRCRSKDWKRRSWRPSKRSRRCRDKEGSRECEGVDRKDTEGVG